MKRILIILTLLLVANLNGQFFKDKLEREKFSERSFDKFYFSYWINPVQIPENFVLNYRIRYDLLIFEKASYDTFLATIKVILEINEGELSTISRNIQEIRIKCSDYSQTVSRDLYYVGVFKLNLPSKALKGKITILDEKSQKEIIERRFSFDLRPEIENFVPIFIKSNDISKIISDTIIYDFYNFLPFESQSYLLILPNNSEFEKIIIKDEKVSFNLSRSDRFGLNFSIFEIDTLDLIEGNYTIQSLSSKINKEFFVVWLNKPQYLFSLEQASKILKYIFNGEEKQFLNNLSRRSDLRDFFTLWKKFDPTPKTAFNELLFEFYRRADFASQEFKSISQPDGALTDRGKIYIIYGAPQKVERTFSQDGRAVEFWYYYSPINKTLKFFDEQKNGNYILQQ